MTILEDYRKKPHLFQTKKINFDNFYKRIPSPPADLVVFWTEVGVGEIYETETIYSPITDDREDNLSEINRYFRTRGLPSTLTVFHTGITISAYRTEAPEYVVIDENSFKIIRSFNSLEEWYNAVIRSEYAQRYSFD